MDKELAPQSLGKSSDKQWYEKTPGRLKEEIDLVKLHYPHFTLSKTGDNENISWIGSVNCFVDGRELYSLKAKIECPHNYPIVFPKVYDVEGILKTKGCPHLNPQDNSICYGNRLDPQLDFTKTTRIKDVIDHVSIFLAWQWYFEENGEWPDGQSQLHRAKAFLDYEVNQGMIPQLDLCPCGMTDLKYRYCHMLKVKELLRELDTRFSDDLKHFKINIGRNDKCPCNNGKEAKKCCFNHLNYPDSKVFLLLKYPSLGKILPPDVMIKLAIVLTSN